MKGVGVKSLEAPLGPLKGMKGSDGVIQVLFGSILIMGLFGFLVHSIKDKPSAEL